MDGFGAVLTGGAIERVGPLETGRTFNLHRPGFARVRPNNGDSPISTAVAKHVLDDGHHLGPPGRIAGILHFNGHRHKWLLYKTDSRAFRPRLPAKTGPEDDASGSRIVLAVEMSLSLLKFD